MARNLGSAPGDDNQLIGYRADALAREVVIFNQPRAIIALHPFTQTVTGTSPATIQVVNSRPCVGFLPSTSTATDGNNWTYGVAGLPLNQGKQLRIFGSFNGADIVNQEFFFGLSAVNTTIINADPTDFIGLRKLKTVAQPSLRMRKASGTAQDITLAIPGATLVNATWYDFEIVVVSDPTTAGLATADVYLGASVAGGLPLKQVAYRLPIVQFPDTVALALALGWRLGSTVNAQFNVGYLGFELEA